MRDSDGRERTIVSSWIAGTDGSHSTVRDVVGTKLEGSFVGERFLLGDVEADYDLDRTSMIRLWQMPARCWSSPWWATGRA